MWSLALDSWGPGLTGTLLLALAGEQITYDNLQHGYKSESHGHGDLLQTVPS